MSVDASYWGGNKTLTPDDAYRFSRGDIVQATNGMNVQLSRPLDFLVIADHAYNMGVVPSLYGTSSILLETEEGKQLLQDFQHYQDTNDQAVYKAIYGTLYGEKIFSKERSHSIWMDVVAKADAYNSPGKFTTFGGYEWTSWGSPQANGGNLHRVVIYKDGADKTNQITPLSSLDSSDPEDLWQSLEQYQQKTGGDVLAIPHNGNVSNGEMFPSVDFDGHPLSVAYAKTRNRWEPLYEVTCFDSLQESHCNIFLINS